MEKQNPFSIYDFLGYLVPGAFLISGVLVLRGIAAHPTDQWLSAIIHQFSFFKQIELYFPFVILAYTLGHLLSFASAVTIERFSVWTIGYPSKFLFFKNANQNPTNKKLAALVKLFILPVYVIERIVRDVLSASDLYAKKLDNAASKSLREKVKVFAREEVGLNDDKLSETDVFRFIYHYVVEHSANHLIKLQNYVALYGFLRTLTLIAVIFFWISAFQTGWALCSGFTWTAIFGWSVLTLSFGFVGFILYLDFVKFSRRFSLEAIMALSAIYPPKEAK